MSHELRLLVILIVSLVGSVIAEKSGLSEFALATIVLMFFMFGLLILIARYLNNIWQELREILKQLKKNNNPTDKTQKKPNSG